MISIVLRILILINIYESNYLSLYSPPVFLSPYGYTLYNSESDTVTTYRIISIIALAKLVSSTIP